MAQTTLISTAELARHLDQVDHGGWVIFDCRHELASPAAGAQAYLQSHIPGAQFMHVDRDLSAAPNGRNGRHPLPDPGLFAAKLSAAGVDASSQVVAYDAAGGMFAARLWWMLRWLGHDRVAVLDGGWRQWQSEQRPTSSAQPAPKPARFAAQPRALTVDTAAVQENLQRKERLLLDARGADRFRGENETLDPVGGHIPGAANRPFRDNLDAAGRFKPAAQLRAEFAAVLGAHAPAAVIHQCGSGVSACHNILAMEVAGMEGSLLYPGSWSEWCADPSRPVAR
jgi:thiosulfate/3-mercaptopyruvate sulfurtransferase